MHEKIQTLLALAALICLLLGAGGCATNLKWYSGPVRNTAEIAVLKVQFNPFGPSARIKAIDGTSVQKGHVFAVNAKEIDFLPGEHTVDVDYFDGNAFSLKSIPLTFGCKAGRVYELHVAPIDEGLRNTIAVAAGGKGHWTAWITDAATKKTLAGVPRTEPLRWYEH